MMPLRAFAAATLLLSLAARGEESPDVALSTASMSPTSSGAAPGPDHGKVVTDDATPAGAGAIEVEAAYGPSLTHAGDGPFDRAAHAHSQAFTLTVLYGVTDQLDLKIGGGFGLVMDETDPTGPTELVSWLQPFAEANYDLQRDGDTHQRLALTAGVNMSAQGGARLLFGVQHAVWGRGVPQTTAGLVALKWAR